MTPEQWQRAREVLADALELRPEERPAFLDRACSSDDALRREVDRLLSGADEARSSFLQPSIFRVGLAPGTRLENYEVQRLLGSGGMGEVYRARDTRLRREVAIKVLPAFLSHDRDRLRRFEQEARAAAALNHPNILAVYQMGTYGGAPYVVSELLEGDTLRELLLRGPLPIRKVIDYGLQMARGLAAAHEKGIAHRDLKPENLFVTKDGRVKILDFGLAKLTQHQTISNQSALTVSVETGQGVVLGTVGYMAPEQVRGKTHDHRGDIFAFGAILYEMLTGKRAFQKPTSAETMTAILNEDPPNISQTSSIIPPALQRVLRRCLEKNPEQRFQSASDLAFALEALSGSEGVVVNVVDVQAPKRLRSSQLWWAVSVLIVVFVFLTIFRLVSASKIPVDPSSWVQITTFPDSVTQPALSPDGHILTFVRGPDTFAGPGQIYVKMLPEGEPVQLTQDTLQKMSPVFSPDGSRIAYTTVPAENRWDTWIVPILGGQPRLWLPNASGLVWPEKGKILFSEIKDNFIHMATVAAAESRAGERDIYVPAGNLGMVHRSYPSPDNKWALVVEMDRAAWLTCRLVPMDGSSAGRQVGPPAAGCTFAAWSPDGKWMYLSSNAGGAFHIWRQRFPEDQPEQVTSGPTEEEGIAMATDGHSLITAVGMRQSSVWLHDSRGERQVSLEGYSFDPKFTPDGKKLCYRILRGTLPTSDPSELRVLELDSGQNEALLPGFSVKGRWGAAYDISPDGQQVVAAIDHEGRQRLLLAPLDRRSPPHYIPNVEGQRPVFGPGGEVFFRAIEGTSSYAYRVHQDGTGLLRVMEQPGTSPMGISQDGQWLLARATRGEGPIVSAYPLRSGSPVAILGDNVLSPGDPLLRWFSGGKVLAISVPTAALRASGRTYVIPLPRGRAFPELPAGGFQSEAEIARLPGARWIDAFDVAVGPTPEVYAFARETVQRNLFRVPLH